MTGSSRSALRAVALVALLALLLFGACGMAFLCDDAFITFRYVANAHDGHGLVWNPSPFRPVEGYTCFSWAMLLWATWSWLGIEPPAAANWLSIACGVGQFVLLASALFRLRRLDGSRWPDAVVLLALGAVVGNRSFLQWLTSGLETALFHLAVLAWVLLAFRQRQRRGSGWLALWCGAAAAAALTRPDGLLLVVLTVVPALVEAWRARAARLLWGLLPLAAVALHLGWRLWFYGELLPNTYYAKVATAWPEAGLRYLACFVFEHGTWVTGALAVGWLVVELRRGPRAFAALLGGNVPAVFAVAAITAQVGYYTLVVGGDHFEYRVFSHLVPLGVLATVAMAGRIGLRAGSAAGLVLLLWLAGGVGWLQAWAMRDMAPHGFRAVADVVPAPCAGLFRWYDRQQVWLRVRLICIRCREHARILETMAAGAGTRCTLATPQEPFPVIALSSVGYLGWILRDTGVIDQLGLNDWVVARTQAPPVDPAPMRNWLAANFDALDLDHSGDLDPAELRSAFLHLASGNAQGDDMARALTAGAPSRPGGRLDRQDFVGLADSLLVVRKMAHDRRPPDGYVDALQPNVEWTGGVAKVRPRPVPLSEAAIRAHEQHWWDVVRRRD